MDGSWNSYGLTPAEREGLAQLGYVIPGATTRTEVERAQQVIVPVAEAGWSAVQNQIAEASATLQQSGLPAWVSQSIPAVLGYFSNYQTPEGVIMNSVNDPFPVRVVSALGDATVHRAADLVTRSAKQVVTGKMPSMAEQARSFNEWILRMEMMGYPFYDPAKAQKAYGPYDVRVANLANAEQKGVLPQRGALSTLGNTMVKARTIPEQLEYIQTPEALKKFEDKLGTQETDNDVASAANLRYEQTQAAVALGVPLIAGYLAASKLPGFTDFIRYQQMKGVIKDVAQSGQAQADTPTTKPPPDYIPAPETKKEPPASTTDPNGATSQKGVAAPGEFNPPKYENTNTNYLPNTEQILDQSSAWEKFYNGLVLGAGQGIGRVVGGLVGGAVEDKFGGDEESAAPYRYAFGGGAPMALLKRKKKKGSRSSDSKSEYRRKSPQRLSLRERDRVTTAGGAATQAMEEDKELKDGSNR